MQAERNMIQNTGNMLQNTVREIHALNTGRENHASKYRQKHVPNLNLTRLTV